MRMSFFINLHELFLKNMIYYVEWMNQKKIAMLFKEILYRDTPINDDGQSYFLLKNNTLINIPTL